MHKKFFVSHEYEQPSTILTKIHIYTEVRPTNDSDGKKDCRKQAGNN